MGSFSPDKQKWAGTEWECDCCSVRAVPVLASAASFSGFPPKRWEGLCAIHNCQFFSAAPALAINSVIYTLVQLCNVAQTPCLQALPQEHHSVTDLLSATAHRAAPLYCLHNSRVSFLMPLAFKTKYYYLCLLVCLLVNPFKKAMD